jgi:hypothetical protein
MKLKLKQQAERKSLLTKKKDHTNKEAKQTTGEKKLDIPMKNNNLTLNARSCQNMNVKEYVK